METTIFQGGKVLLPDGLLEAGTVVVRGGKIVAVGETAGAHTGRVIRFEGKILVPGFIDVHIHGGGGGDWMDQSHAAFRKILSTHSCYGTTGLLATTITTPLDRLKECVSEIVSLMETQTTGPRILGIHLEGPYINPLWKGAHRADWIQTPRLADMEMLLDHSRGTLKWITLAPEGGEESEEILRYLSSRGVVCAVGHSDATYEEVCRCLNHGLSHVTHLYNAMRPYHHREPGIIGAALTRDELTLELIADGIHVSFPALQVAVKAKDWRKILLITDAIRATGMPDGEYELGGQAVTVKDGVARLQDGTLAGSTLTMNRAVFMMMKLAGLPFERAIQMASAIPAQKLGVDDRKGWIKEGYDADLLIVDESLHVYLTMVAGETVYRDKGWS
ncbi:N-acetylglucosamine-6-phosphate deacetylase [Bacillaceae bacterium]